MESNIMNYWEALQMKRIVMNHWGIVDSRFANAVCKDIECMMDCNGMGLWEVIHHIDAVAKAEQCGIFEAWYDNGNNTDNTSSMIDMIMAGIHAKNATVDDVLELAGVLSLNR